MKKIITTVNDTDNIKEILNLFKEKIKDNNQGMQQESNALISRIDEVNNFFIERKTADVAICRLKEGRLAQCLGNFYAKCSTLFCRIIIHLINGFMAK